MPAPVTTSTGRRGSGLALTTRRVLQFTVDLAIVVLLCGVPLSLTLLVPEDPLESVPAMLVAFPVLVLVGLACLLISAWYWVLLPAGRGGRTPAMGWFGLRIVSAPDGRAATSGQLAARWVMLLVDGTLGGLVGLVGLLATRGERRIGDIVAGTIVRADR